MMLGYAQTYPNAKICYHTSNIILDFESYAAYLVMTGYCSRIYGHYYLSDHLNNPTNPSDVNPNGPILNQCNTIQHVVSSAAEDETGGIFVCCMRLVRLF